MFNKRYIFFLIVSIVIFFGWQDVIKADTKECKYLTYAVAGQLVDVDEGDEINTVKLRAIYENKAYSYMINLETITLYREDTKDGYNALECPTYLVNFKEYKSNVYRAYKDDPAPKNLKKINIAFKLLSEDTAVQDSGSYKCKYNAFTHDKNSQNSTKTPFASDVEATVYYKKKINGVSGEIYDIFFTFNNISTSDYFEFGNNSDPLTRTIVQIGSCPEYVVPTHKKYGGISIGNTYHRFADGFNAGSEEKVYAEANSEYGFIRKDDKNYADNTANGNNGVYYQVTDKQREDNTKNKPSSGTCAYYRGEHKLQVVVTRNTYPALEYVITSTYISGLGNKTGLNLKTDSNSVDRPILEAIVNNANAPTKNATAEEIRKRDEPCLDYEYLEVGDLSNATEGGMISLNFIPKITDVKKIFKYFKIATTDQVASQYKTKLDEAYKILFIGDDEFKGLVTIVKDSNNTETMNKNINAAFLHYAKNGGSDDITNVASYLLSGGKASKAIYDYANYWYAMATNYASLYVFQEKGCDNSCNDASQYNDPNGENGESKYNTCLANTTSPCLKFKAIQLAQEIEENVKAGYIPIPDGCDMLSQDLLDFLTWALQLIRYGAVIITIVLGMVDFFRAIAESDDKAFQKAGGRFLKRLIAVVLIFLSALFVQFILYNYALPGIGEEEVTLCNISKKVINRKGGIILLNSAMDYIILPVLSWLDTIFFGLIGTIYELLMRIADATFFNQDVFREFSTRIYSLLGIFMLFRLTFSLITYTINPDDLTEKSKGVQNIISRILITLVLLIITPTIFVRARELQKIILDNSVLESVILGIGASGDNVANPAGIGDTKNTAGSRLSFVLLSTFLEPEKEFFPGCSSGMYLSGGVNMGCLNDLNGKETSGDVPLGSYVENAWKYKDVSILLDADLLRANDGSGQRYMKYQYIISTLAAVFVCYILLVFCIDIAVRSVKLGFLELIAPIPILGNIDPKASKDSTFNKWVKMVLNTYLDLFLRLASIYFCIFIFDNIDLVTTNSGNFVSDSAVKVFIILGALTFAKQLPDILKEFFPGMGKGTFDLNLKKKLSETPGMKQATGLAALGGAAVGAGATNFARNVAETASNWGDMSGGKKAAALARTAFSGLTGGASAMRRGAGASLSGKKAGEIYKSAYGGATQARDRYATSREAGATMRGTAAAKIQSGLGMHNLYERQKAEIGAYEEYMKVRDNVDNFAEKKVLDNKDGYYNNVINSKNRIETLRNSGAAESDITKEEKNYHDLLDIAKKDYVRDQSANQTGSLYYEVKNMKSIQKQYENYEGFQGFDSEAYGGFDDAKKHVLPAKKSIELDDKHRVAKANADAAAGSGGSGGGSSKKPGK